MDEAMNLDGMSPAGSYVANSSANSVLDIVEEGAALEAIVNQPSVEANNDTLSAPITPVVQESETATNPSPITNIESVNVANDEIISAPVVADNNLEPITEKIIVEGPLGPTEIDAARSVVESHTPVIETAPLIAETNDELDEVAAMGKELFESAQSSGAKSENLFSNMDFGPLKKYIDEDDITDISYSNGGQLWLKSLSRGVYRAAEQNINDALVEKIAFQCSNVMGKTFNMAHPFLDSESAELRMNFVHDSIARNGIAAVFRKTPARIRLEKDKLLEERYITLSIHDFLLKAVKGHCNIIVAGETGSGKTELVKYLASHTDVNEKLITIEDTLELHLDRIFPERDIVAMKTNNIASYTDVLITCMRQNPKWILLSEVRSAEAVTAVRNSISSGHNILSTIHADKAENIPQRMYSLLESDIDIDQFLTTIHRYVHLGVYVRGRYDASEGRFVREIGEVTEFYVDENNKPVTNTIYRKSATGVESYHNISPHLLEYLEGQAIDISDLRNFAPDNTSVAGEELEDINVGRTINPNFSQMPVETIV